MYLCYYTLSNGVYLFTCGHSQRFVNLMEAATFTYIGSGKVCVVQGVAYDIGPFA